MEWRVQLDVPSSMTLRAGVVLTIPVAFVWYFTFLLSCCMNTMSEVCLPAAGLLDNLEELRLIDGELLRVPRRDLLHRDVHHAHADTGALLRDHGHRGAAHIACSIQRRSFADRLRTLEATWTLHARKGSVLWAFRHAEWTCASRMCAS